MNHIMLDLETMGIGVKPALLSIAAVQFCPKTNTIGDKFHFTINLQSCIDAGLEVTASTIKFWVDQGEESREYLSHALDSTIELKFALERYSEFVNGIKKKHGQVFLWGNSIKADNLWLDSAFSALGMTPPTNYREDACYRTLNSLYFMKFNKWPEIKFEGVKHNPLDDCLHQIKVLNHILEEL